MIRVSVIVPVYQGEQFLRKCMDSILAQTLTDIEVICVDDGSTDNSLAILNEYACRDARVKCLPIQHGGLVAARKAGVSVASADYVGFVDCDDWIEPCMYERLYSKAAAVQADIVSHGYIQEGNYISTSYDAVPDGDYVSAEAMDRLRGSMIFVLSERQPGLLGSLATKLMKRECIRQALADIPNDIDMSEDKMTLVRLMLECGSAVILHEAYYHYILHGKSMTHKPSGHYLQNVAAIYGFLQGLYGHKCFTAGMRKQADLYVVQLLLKGINTRLGLSFRNLMWIDPYWLERIPLGARVALYGAGDLGRKFRQQLLADGRFVYAGCVDRKCQVSTEENGLQVLPLADLTGLDFDCVVITIKHRGQAEEARSILQEMGVCADKIFWFPQEEIFWRFAQADGLLD